jgi:hypothetical protein
LNVLGQRLWGRSTTRSPNRVEQARPLGYRGLECGTGRTLVWRGVAIGVDQRPRRAASQAPPAAMTVDTAQRPAIDAKKAGASPSS